MGNESCLPRMNGAIARFGLAAAAILAMSVAACDAGPPKQDSVATPSGDALDTVVFEKITAASHLTDQPWPFPVPEVEIFCAKPGLDVFGFDGKFGALNGTMTGFARKGYGVVLADGRHARVVGIDDNQDLRNAGLVLPDAATIPINYWTGAMNDRLSACWR